MDSSKVDGVDKLARQITQDVCDAIAKIVPEMIEDSRKSMYAHAAMDAIEFCRAYVRYIDGDGAEMCGMAKIARSVVQQVDWLTKPASQG